MLRFKFSLQTLGFTEQVYKQIDVVDLEIAFAKREAAISVNIIEEQQHVKLPLLYFLSLPIEVWGF